MASFMITNMGFLPSMRSRMDSQRTSLNEALVAIFHCTVVRPFVGMYAIMSAKIRLAIERLLISVRLGQGGKGREALGKKTTFPQCSQEQLKSRPLPGAMAAAV